MPPYSESFYITCAGIGSGGLALILFYFKSTLLTSRCSEVVCCWGGCRIQNQVLDSDAVVDVIERERPPGPATIPQQSQAPTPPERRSASGGRMFMHQETRFAPYRSSGRELDPGV